MQLFECLSDECQQIFINHFLNCDNATLRRFAAGLDSWVKGLTVITDDKGRPVRYEVVAKDMRNVKAAMQHPDAMTYVTHGLRKNATIELYQAGNDDELVKAVTGHSGAEMLKKYGGQIRQRELAARAQEARNRWEQNRPGT